MNIIDLIDDKIVISPEALCISPFSELWENDKSKAKTLATKQIKYIWFFTDFNSPYYQHPEVDRHNLLLLDVIKDKDFKVTKEIKEGILKYKQLTTSPAIRMVEAANILAGKMEQYFKDVDLDVVDVKKVTDIFINMPKIISSLKEAEKKCNEEFKGGVKRRGTEKTAMFEE